MNSQDADGQDADSPAADFGWVVPLLASLGPEGAAAAGVVEVAPVAIDAFVHEAEGIAAAIARSGGFTAEADYQGLVPLAGILAELLYKPVMMAWTIEQQWAGVMEALYKFLGGEATALQDGAKVIENWFGQLGKDLGL